MGNTLSLTEDEVSRLMEYINLTLSDFRESADNYNEDSEQHCEIGALAQDISTLSSKFVSFL